MKQFYASFFLLFVVFSAFAQNDTKEDQIRILKSKISKSQKAEKLKWMDSLSLFILFETQKGPDSILRATVHYALQLDSLNIAGARLADIMDYSNNALGKPEVAQAEFFKHRDFIKHIDNYAVLADIYLNLGDSYYYLKDYTTSIKYYDSTQAFAKKGNAKRLLALAKMYKGSTLAMEGNFAQASKDLQEAVKVFREMKDTFNIISAKNSLSILYSQNAFYDEAKTERDEAIVLTKKIKNTAQLVSFYFNAATDNKKTGDKQLEIKNLNTSLMYARKTKPVNIYEPFILLGLSTAYSEQGNVRQAEKYLNEAESKPENIKGPNESSYLEALKNLAFAKKDYQKALLYAQQDLALEGKTTQFEEIMIAEKFLSEVYEKLGNSPQALLHYKNFYTIKDSIVNVQNAKALSYYQTIYETEKRDLKIKAQESDIALLDAENREKNQLLLFGGLGLVGIFGFIVLNRSISAAKKRQKLQEGFSQDLIKAQEEERIRVARELHDSVGQKLMLFTKKTKATGDVEMELLAGNTLEELRNISRGLHPATLERLGVTAAIKTMINEVDAHTNIFFTHEIEDIDSSLTKEASLHLYRIIQEVLNNMVKHADAKAASIVIEKNLNIIETTIMDNGKGFEYSEKIKTSASLGMKTLMERARILHSQIDIKSQINKGTTIKLNIPT